MFYREFNQLNKTVDDNAVGGSIIKQSYGVAATLLDQVIKQSRGWHTIDTEMAMRAPSISF